jgi:hypothetical protein
VVEAPVFIVSGTVTEAPVAITADAGTLQVAGLGAAEGAVVTAQERLIAPRNPFLGAMVMVEVFPVEAPAITAMDPLLVIEKLDAATETLTVPVAPR